MVIVRDEEWLVTRVEQTADGRLLHCQGLSELVRDTTASFYEGLDDIEPLDPRRRRSWRMARPGTGGPGSGGVHPPQDRGAARGAALTVSDDMLADSLGYQQAAVRQALDPKNLRTRILLADAVGLGKTLEIGMILAELVRRGAASGS